MPDIDIEEFRNYLRIDKHQLDDELEAQSEMLFKISEASVQASAHRDMLKEQLATVDAELDGKHRPAREIARDFLRSTGLR